MDYKERLKETCRQVLGFLIRAYGLYLAVTSFGSMLYVMSLDDRLAASMGGSGSSHFFSIIIGAALFILADNLLAMTYRKTAEEQRAERAASRS